ncbi:insulinase family protein [Escherichia fergusonii]|uniref:insulinase family protein n=1 Tax=Escherichia fergusonii TaxID=564 RepID=UPI0024B34F94|nr:insulinase family protein [Escherichia fergusonii]
MRKLCYLLTFVATLLLIPERLIAAPLPQDEKLITGQLQNGLKYMIYPHAQPKDQVNLWLQIHTGSLQEEDNERGVAHFVEHMMFNGTKTWPGNKVIETFESMGLRFGRDVNAYTSYDETVYQVSLPTTQKENLQKVMSIFSEWSAEATFDEKEVAAERGVITEEWRAHQDAKWRTSQARRPFLLANTPFLSPQQTYQLSERLWAQITVESLAQKWQQLRKNQDAFWEQMVNSDAAATKALSPQAIKQLEKTYADKKLPPYVFPGINLTLTVADNAQAKITHQEKLADDLTSLTLSNGARVVVAKTASNEEKLQIIAVSDKGDLSFPAEQKAIIALANKAVSGSGVGQLSASSLKRWSAENAVTMSTKVSGQNTLLSVNARVNNPEPGFQLLNQRISNSKINDNIWESMKNAQIQSLKTLDQRPAEKFAQQMYEARYADDRAQRLTEKQLAQFSAEQALAVDRRLFSSPADLTFVIVGNIDEETLLPLVTRYIGSLKQSEHVLSAGQPLKRATTNANITLKEQNEPVAQVAQWKRFDTRSPVTLPVRMALDAFNAILAKDLRVNIREQASGVYSVSSRLSVDKQANDLTHVIGFTCQPERHQELLTLANKVMADRLVKGINAQELNEYRKNMQRNLEIQQQNTQQLANTIVSSLVQYNDPAAWTEQEKLLQQLPPEQVNNTARKYLSSAVNIYSGVLLPK